MDSVNNVIAYHEAVYSLVRCKDCGALLAMLPVGVDSWLMWLSADVEHETDPMTIAATTPCCHLCGGNLAMDTDLAALSTTGTWVDVGRNDPVFADAVAMN